jgi:four helix bundle protein
LQNRRAMEKVTRFEELWIWQQARLLVRQIYGDCSIGQASRDFGFRAQIQRASVSIMNNVAEGFERSTDPDFARFLDVAKGSCGEVRSLYYVAEDLGYVDSAMAEERRSTARRLAAGIKSLADFLRGSPRQHPLRGLRV